MHLSLPSKLMSFYAQKRIYRFLLSTIFLVPFLLSACQGAKTQTTQPLILTPIATNAQNDSSTTSTAETVNTAVPAATTAVADSPTPTVEAATQAATATLAPTSSTLTATPAPTTTATASPASIPSIFYPGIPAYYYNMAADIQNNVIGVLQVLNVSGDNGQAYVIILNTYKDKKTQYNASYEIIQYLATYFKGMSNSALAKLFNGTQFAVHIKSISIDNEYIVDTVTPYAVLMQVGQSQVNQGQWEALVDAQIQMQYHVTALCSVSPNSISANTDTKLMISGWLLYQSKPVKIQYIDASWTDSNGTTIYCAGNPYDSTCHSHSGHVTPGSTITVNVTFQAYDGLKYTCKTAFSAP